MWTEPEGNSSFFRVQLTKVIGNESWMVDTNETSVNITNFTAGSQYKIDVSAVANDGQTEGEKRTVLNYTREYACQVPSCEMQCTNIHQRTVSVDLILLVWTSLSVCGFHTQLGYNPLFPINIFTWVSQKIFNHLLTRLWLSWKMLIVQCSFDLNTSQKEFGNYHIVSFTFYVCTGF